VSKQIKVSKTAKTATPTTTEKARKVWLAGLGAVSIVQKQGIDLFESMVHEGKTYQVSSEKLIRKVSAEVKSAVDSRLKPVKIRVKAIRSDAEAKVEQGIGRVLSYAGIPSKADVDALIARVDKLSRQLRTAK
jgi:poly(hydroxyalkanoate) granule-associated protein